MVPTVASQIRKGRHTKEGKFLTCLNSKGLKREFLRGQAGRGEEEGEEKEMLDYTLSLSLSRPLTGQLVGMKNSHIPRDSCSHSLPGLCCHRQGTVLPVTSLGLPDKYLTLFTQKTILSTSPFLLDLGVLLFDCSGLDAIQILLS